LCKLRFGGQFHRFLHLATCEFALLTSLPEFEAIKALQELSYEGDIAKSNSRTGEMWRL
jgi:hypothetical protein